MALFLAMQLPCCEILQFTANPSGASFLSNAVKIYRATWTRRHSSITSLIQYRLHLVPCTGFDLNDAYNATGAVMLTALDANDDQVLGFHAGADVYLSKRRWPGLLLLLCLLSMRMAMLVAMAASTHAAPVLVSLIFATMTPQRPVFQGPHGSHAVTCRVGFQKARHTMSSPKLLITPLYLAWA